MNYEKTVHEYFSKEEVVSKYSKCDISVAERQIFKRYLKKRSKILDLCCGGGRVAIPLAKMGFEVVGVDNNEKMKQLLQNKRIKNFRFFCNEADKIKFKEKTFDYVLLLQNSLEHIPSEKKRKVIIKKIYKILKNDGIFITSFHSIFYPPNIFFKLLFQNTRALIGLDGFNNLILKFKENGEINELFYHFFSPLEIRSLLKPFKEKNIITINELDKTENKFKSLMVYKLFRPLFYCFYIAKK